MFGHELLREFLTDEGGQDLAEYALLAAFVGIAALAALSALQSAIKEGYIRWDTAEQDLWEPPPPE